MKTAPFARSFDLHGKTAIVTGGALGIGAACALRLAELGAKVAILDTDARHADQTAHEIRVEGDFARRFKCDLAEVKQIEQSIKDVIEAFGRIDVVVNNAGIFPMTPALEIREEMWDRVMEVNLKGAFFCAQLAARRMVREGHGGSIVNISSVDAFHPTGRLAHYDASKGGLVMLTRSLAKELAPHGIRVNTVAPGAIATPGATGAMDDTTRDAFVSKIPLQRLGAPDDIARAVVFFASEASNYITGSTLVVDGGLLVA